MCDNYGARESYYYRNGLSIHEHYDLECCAISSIFQVDLILPDIIWVINS